MVTSAQLHETPTGRCAATAVHCSACVPAMGLDASGVHARRRAWAGAKQAGQRRCRERSSLPRIVEWID